MRAIITVALTAFLVQSPVPTIRTRLDLVVVPTSVQDSKGNLVTTLGVEDFQILEDGRPQVLTGASIEASMASVEVIRDNGLNAAPFASQANLLKEFSDSYSGINGEDHVPHV